MGEQAEGGKDNAATGELALDQNTRTAYEWVFSLSMVLFRFDLLKTVILGCPLPMTSTWICMLFCAN